MMLIEDAETSRHQETGAWGRVTLDMLVHRAAQSHGDQLAIADAPDRAEWTGSAPRSLTYAELEAEIARIAVAFSGLGLEPGSTIGLLAPNCVDTVAIFLGALRAGLIVAPLPLTWRAAEIQPAYDILGVKAVVVADRLEDARLAEIARDVAIDIFGVRFVLGFGQDLPDGVAPFDQIIQAIDEAGPAKSATADNVATVTWANGENGALVPLPRSHNQWIAAGLMHLLEGRIEPGTKLHSAFQPTGIVGIGAVLVPWLLAAGTLHLHHFRDLDRYAADISATGADRVVAPETLVDATAERLSAQDAQLPAFSAVWRNGHPAENDAASHGARADVDLLFLDEFAYFAALRTSRRPASMPVGPITAPQGAAGGPVLMETRLVGKPARAGDSLDGLLESRVAVSGAMVPHADWPGGRAESLVKDDAGFVITGLQARPVSTDPARAELSGRAEGFAVSGGAVVSLGELDDLMSEVSPKGLGAGYTVSDPVLGDRLAGTFIDDSESEFDPNQLKAFLEEKKIGLHKRPANVKSATSLPVRLDGSIDRTALARRAAD